MLLTALMTVLALALMPVQELMLALLLALVLALVPVLALTLLVPLLLFQLLLFLRVLALSGWRQSSSPTTKSVLRTPRTRRCHCVELPSATAAAPEAVGLWSRGDDSAPRHCFCHPHGSVSETTARNAAVKTTRMCAAKKRPTLPPLPPRPTTVKKEKQKAPTAQPWRSHGPMGSLAPLSGARSCRGHRTPWAARA